MSFHACGPNVGDEVDIPLPSWVLDAAKHNPSLLYRDKHGYQNPECLSLWADEEPALAGRTPLQCYADFMASFRVRPRASRASPPLVHWLPASGEKYPLGGWAGRVHLWRKMDAPWNLM
jgi:hypothetical protein